MTPLKIDLNKVEKLKNKHRRFWKGEDIGERLVTFGCSRTDGFDLSYLLDDPQMSLELSLSRLAKVLEYGDDSIPMVRVEFGTILSAMAFGAGVGTSQNGWPMITTHPISTQEDLLQVRHPDPMTAGAFAKAHEFIGYFREHLHPGINLCQPDMQGPWNTAHLIAGDKIFLDIYDAPEFVAQLLDASADL